MKSCLEWLERYFWRLVAIGLVFWFSWLFRFEHVHGSYFLDRWRGEVIRGIGDFQRGEFFDLTHRLPIEKNESPSDTTNIFDDVLCVNGKRGKHCDIP